MQLVTMQFTQLSKGALEVVQVLNGISKGGQHLLAMSFDLGVAHYGRGRGQVAKFVKEPLCPGVDGQKPIDATIADGKIKDSQKKLKDFPNEFSRLIFTILAQH